MIISAPQLTTIFLVGLLFSGLFSMLEAAVISQDRHRLASLADNGNANAAVMRAMLANDIERLLAAILLCNNLANVTCATAATALATRIFGGGDSALLAVTLLVTFVILVGSEITPKVVGVRHAGAIAVFSARPLRRLLWLLSPLIQIANWLSSCLLFIIGVRRREAIGAPMNINELRAAVRASAQADNDSESGRHYHMLKQTLSFNEMPVEKIMTPRRDIYGINLRQNVDKIARRIMDSNFSKLPLFDGDQDEPKGVIDVAQALKLIRDNRLSAENLLAQARKACYAPAAAGAMRQLQRMRQEGARLALVLDGGGRVIGMLTFANFSAAIIGDEKPPSAERLPNGALDVPADITLLQLERLDRSLSPPEKTSAATLNGLILERLGDLPTVPVCPLFAGWRMEITKLDKKAVREVRFHPPSVESDKTC